jgi:hypothetical protein
MALLTHTCDSFRVIARDSVRLYFLPLTGAIDAVRQEIRKL